MTAGQDDELRLVGDVALLDQGTDVDVELARVWLAGDLSRRGIRACPSSFHPSGGEAQSTMKTSS